MNQHFNKKTIEAAVRTAFVNKENAIAINGKRSKVRYYVDYESMFGNLHLTAETKENGYTVEHSLSLVDVNNIIRSQRNKDQLVSLVTKHFIDKIGEFKSELKAA